MSQTETKAATNEMPVLFVSHGAGPCFFIKEADAGGLRECCETSEVTKLYKSLATHIATKPTAILVISAHWETPDEFAVTSVAKNTLYYDYGGFPDYTYKLQYEAPGSESLAEQVKQLVSQAGLKCRIETKRGIDHGVFVPLKLIYPAADIPVIQLSLQSSLDPALHLKLGQQLQPLRKSGVLIIGSGQATHGPSRVSADKVGYSKKFVTWLEDVMTNAQYTSDKRNSLLVNFQRQAESQFAELAHPRIEHFVPIMVAAGASGDNRARKLFDPIVLGEMSLATYLFETN